MPADGDLAGFLERLGKHRGRPIRILPQKLGGGRPTSGFWLPAEHADYLVVDQPTTPSRRNAIVCHEVAHMLLGHEPDTASGAIAAAAPDLSPELVTRALGRHGYATDDEAEAEQLGTLIGAEQLRLQINSSRLR